MATTLFGQAYAPYLALGVGELGGRASAAGCLDGFGEKIPWAACDTHSGRLLATGLERKLRLDLPRAFRPEFVKRSLDAQAEPLRRLLKKKELVILFGALDEPALLPLCAGLGTQLKRESRRVCTIGLEPTLSANSESIDPPKGSDLFLRVSIAGGENALSSDVPATRLARLGEETLSYAVEALMAALVGCDSAPDFSFGELHEFLRGGAISSVVGTAQGRDAVMEAFEQAWSAGRVSEATGVALALVAGREFSWAEVRNIRSTLLEAFGDETSSLIGFGTDPAVGDEARCLVMCRPASSRNVVQLRSV